MLLHLESGAYHELNPVGAAIWSLLDGDRDLEGIAAELHAVLEDAPDDLEDIVSDYLVQLRERGLID